jgi:mercuric ion transport protein
MSLHEPLRKALDKVGVAGAVIAALCCLGVPAIVAIFSAIGLAFVFNDAILLPVMIVSIALTVGGLLLGWRHHRKPWAVLLAATSGVLLVFATFAWHARALSYAAIVGLIAASTWNVLLAHHREGSARENVRRTPGIGRHAHEGR